MRHVATVVRHRWFIILVLWTVVTSVNITKAVHLDDTAYLEIAEHIQDAPLHPMSGFINWHDVPEPIQVLNQPHLFFYVLAGWMSVAGRSDFALHALMAIVTLGTIVAFWSLAALFAPGQEGWLSVLLFAGPAFLPGQNLMVDVPLLLFSLLAIRGLTAGVLDGRGWMLASLCCALAILTKYTALALLPLLAVCAALVRGIRGAWIVAIPLLAVTAWSVANFLDYGGIHILQRPTEGPIWLRFAGRAPQLLLCLGSVAPFSVMIGRRFFGSVRSCAAFLAATLMLGAIVTVRAHMTGSSHGVSWPIALAAGLFTANGAWVLAAVASLCYRVLRERWNPSIALLAGWAGFVGLFLSAFAPFMAVRHVLMVVPPLLLLIGGVGQEVTRSPARKWLAVSISCLLGGTLAVSDWIYADVYRREATLVRTELGADATIWFTGHWGWQWYAHQNGMRQYATGESALQHGDYFVKPALVDQETLAPPDRARLVFLRVDSCESQLLTTVRTMSVAPWGGFYSSSLWSLPWRLSRDPLEQFDIYRVR